MPCKAAAVHDSCRLPLLLCGKSAVVPVCYLSRQKEEPMVSSTQPCFVVLPHWPCAPPTAAQVANEIWVVDKGTVQKWNGDIVSYKQHLRQQHAALAKRDDMK